MNHHQEQTLSLISNNINSNMQEELFNSIQNCKSFIFSVAFINYSGLQLLLKAINDAKTKGVKGKIITSDYLNFTEPKAIRKLMEFENIETKIYLQHSNGGFHTKAYIFEFENEYHLYIGSSNITQSALLKNIEWNVKILSKKDHSFVIDIFNQFNELWNKTKSLDDHFLNEYEKFIESLTEYKQNEEAFIYKEETVRPNSMQLRAIQNLNNLRNRGEDRGLVIAATATGKTYMSAFDVQNYKPNKLLFLVHREDILLKAVESFKKVLGSKIDIGILSGNSKEFDKKYLFSTINSMQIHYERFKVDEFDYIILDESHHAVSKSYQEVMNYFKPNFILGMTATPERSDGFELFSYFKNNIALEIRLNEAIENDLVCPFHYFGVTEVEGVDYENIDLDNSDKITELLSVSRRVEYVIEKLKFYGHDGKKLKALGFCASLDHAEYMANEFNNRGIKSVFLSGSDKVSTREQFTKELESDDSDSLQVIFSVDIFNEGIDIPSVNTVMMLRPTSSPIIFIQQLGRGLRKFKNKEYVTVLDFIGNYKKSFLIAIALNGSNYLDKDSLKVSVRNNFKGLPGTSFVQMDEIAKEQILKQLEFENFNSFKYLKDEYMEFKKSINYRTPIFLMEYELLEGSPDPVKFINYSRTYIEFIKRIESSLDFSKYKISQDFLKLLSQLSFELPIKRPHEFLLIDLLLHKKSISYDYFKSELETYVGNNDDGTLVHSIRNLLGDFKDSGQLKRYLSLIEYDKEKLLITRSNNWPKIINSDNEVFIKDVVRYGLTRFVREFGFIEYKTPFFKLYQTYTMMDAAILSNEIKKTSSYRGQGLITHKNDYFIYVELNKSEDIKESINYKDKIIDEFTMQWESQNKTKQDSNIGKNIINNKERNINLHMFVRKFKMIDGLSQPFIYLGLVDTYQYENNAPIRFKFKFQQPIPSKLLQELITETKSN